jgi:two-component system response regulator AtoC
MHESGVALIARSEFRPYCPIQIVPFRRWRHGGQRPARGHMRLLRSSAAREALVSVVQETNPPSYSPFRDGSAQMRAIGTVIESIADTDATVLIRGESGVGKDLVARTLHATSARHGGPFIKVNCAAIPDGLLESELFGYEKGAFTGAHRRKPGQFEYANKGTLYLDEIAELPLALQAKLLHVLQDYRFSRVGGHELLEIDVRVLAATNQDLERAVAEGRFREDLYYRLNVVEIRVPPLRERREEIPELAARFLARFNAQYGRQRQLTHETLARLMRYTWSGNVRELENVMRRLVLLPDGEQAIALVTRDQSGHNGHGSASSLTVVEGGLREIGRRGAREAERKALLEVLERVSWNRAAAARILQVSYKTLLTKISECGLTPPPRRWREFDGDISADRLAESREGEGSRFTRPTVKENDRN